MNDYVLNNKPELAANEMVWAFDLGHPLRLERRFLRSREREKVAQPDEGRWGETIQCGAGRGEVSNSGHQKTAVRRGNEFLHKASLPCRAVAQRKRLWRDEVKQRLVIPAEFALPRGRECCACLRRPRSRVLPRGETKTAAGRRRMWRTRQAHKACEQWLNNWQT